MEVDRKIETISIKKKACWYFKFQFDIGARVKRQYFGRKNRAIQFRTAKLMFVLTTHYATILIGTGKQHIGDAGTKATKLLSTDRITNREFR